MRRIFKQCIFCFKYIILLFLPTQCTSLLYNPVDDISIPYDDPALLPIINRAKQIATISWVPKNNIPNNIDYYVADQPITGIPYSSVKEKDKFIGQEVSFLTFLTAVNNPRSVLYTENVSKSPYNGVNCSCYYGTVCSMAVNYALGLSLPIETDMYEDSSLFEYVQNQTIYGAKRGDLLLSKGHVVMILDIKEDREHNVKKVIILESSSTRTSIRYYSLDAFQTRWDKDKWILLRYKNLASSQDYSPIQSDRNIIDYSSYEYNNELCTSRGDYVTYRKGEDVVINVLSSEYDFIELYKDDIFFSKQKINQIDIPFNNLPCGQYKARIISSNKKSNFIHFEVLDTNVMIESASISYKSTNSEPEYLVVCKKNGERYFITPLNQSEIAISDILKSCTDFNDIYLKVFFKGQYGRVSNEPIEIKFHVK